MVIPDGNFDLTPTSLEDTQRVSRTGLLALQKHVQELEHAAGNYTTGLFDEVVDERDALRADLGEAIKALHATEAALRAEAEAHRATNNKRMALASTIESLERRVALWESVDGETSTIESKEQHTKGECVPQHVYEDAIESRDAEIERLRAEVKGLENLRALVDRDTSEKDALRAERDTLREELREAEARKTNAEKAFAVREEQLAEYVQRVRELEEELGRALADTGRAYVQRVNARIDSLRHQVESLRGVEEAAATVVALHTATGKVTPGAFNDLRQALNRGNREEPG